MQRNASSGFILVGVLVAVIIALVAVAGYIYYTNQPKPASLQQATDTTPSAYQSSTDLDTAATSLDDTDINTQLDASLEQLDAEVNNF